MISSAIEGCAWFSLGPEHQAPTSEQRCGDAHRDPPRDTADERRPARADEPGGRPPGSAEKPPHARRCPPRRAGAAPGPERPAAEPGHRPERAEPPPRAAAP